MLCTEVTRSKVQCIREDREREVHGRRDRALHYLLRLADVDEICILTDVD